jgi:hypothetical protein
VTKRNLIIIHRGPEYQRDFDEIAGKVLALDRNISIYSVPSAFTGALPPAIWQQPTLTVALLAKFRVEIRRGPILKNRAIEKLAQQEVFRKHGIPTPPAMPFRFGMTVDPLLFGEFVILKPMDLEQTSKGDGVHLIRRRRLHDMKIGDFPAGHPLQKARSGYLVQRFVDTGEYPSFYRVQTFLGKAIYAWHSTLVIPRCPLTASDTEIEATTVASQGGEKTRELISDPDIIALAERVHAAFPQLPMLAVDCIKEERTGKLFILECNAGGNTWHFSSKVGEKLRLGFGNAAANGPEKANEIARQMFIDQFGAFDIVARQLVSATHNLAV